MNVKRKPPAAIGLGEQFLMARASDDRSTGRRAVAGCRRKIGWFGRIVIVAGLLALTVAFLWFCWVAGATKRRDMALIALHQAGIATDTATFLDRVEPVSPEVDPAVEYERAWSLIDSREETWRAWDDFYPATANSTPEEEAEKARLERAVVGKYEQSIRLVIDADVKIRPAVDRVQADFGTWSQRNGPVPADMIMTRQPHLYRPADLTRLLHADANVAAADGDADRVLGHALRMIGMADAIDSDARWLPDHGAAVGIRARTVAMVIDNADIAVKGTPALRAEVITLLLDDEPSSAAYASAMAGEATMQQCALRELEAGKVDFDIFAYGCCPPRVPPRELLTAVIRDDAAQAAHYMLAMMHTGEASRIAKAQLHVPAAWFEEGRLIDYFTRTLLPTVKRAFVDEFHNRTDRRLAAAALAIRSYEHAHGGRLPPDLNALVPEYLPRVPIDPMAADGDLRYDVERALLWSVGVDGEDDDADESPVHRRPHHWAMKDVVLRLRP